MPNEIERTIAEFIPHRDSQYIKPLAEVLKELVKGCEPENQETIRIYQGNEDWRKGFNQAISAYSQNLEKLFLTHYHRTGGCMELKEAISILKNVIDDETNGLSEQIEEAINTLILPAENVLAIGKVTDSLMYDFPKSYTKAQIIAYQKALDKSYSAIRTSLGVEKEA